VLQKLPLLLVPRHNARPVPLSEEARLLLRLVSHVPPALLRLLLLLLLVQDSPMVVSAAVRDDCTGVRASPASAVGAGAAAGMAWPARGSRNPAQGTDRHAQHVSV
jgi:hypothetical protein